MKIPLPPSSQINVSNLFSVKDKVIVVTGGGSGIGAMIAAGFCDNGSRVYIVSRKDTSAYARELNSRNTGGKCIALQADLSKPADVENLANEINRLEPAGVHVLVNNAGTNWAQPFTQYSLDGWDRVYDLNVRALFHVTQQLFPALKRTGTRDDPARVINIASIDGAQVTLIANVCLFLRKSCSKEIVESFSRPFGNAKYHCKLYSSRRISLPA